YGVYTLLYSEQARERGELTIKQVIQILQQNKVEDEHGHVLDYPRDKCGFIIEAMRALSFVISWIKTGNGS
ncbi:MAG: hypothetical protein ACRERV_09170, partial [Methylococcales bacterium]